MKYYVNMSAADEAKLLAECEALDDAYQDFYGPRHWTQELADAIWLAAQWEIDCRENEAAGEPRERFDNEKYRGYFIDLVMEDEMHELRKAALNHRGEP